MCNAHPNDSRFGRNGLPSGLHTHHSFNVNNILTSDFLVFFVQYAIALYVSYQMTTNPQWYLAHNASLERIKSW